MKFFQRFCCVLLLLCTFVGIFSTTALAEELDSNILVRYSGYLNNSIQLSKTNVSNGESSVTGLSYESLKIDSSTVFHNHYVFTNKDNGILIKKDIESRFFIDNLYFELARNNDKLYATGLSSAYLWVKYADGTSNGSKLNIVDKFTYNSTNKTHSYDLTIDYPKDIVEIHIEEYIAAIPLSAGTYTAISYGIGGKPFKMVIEEKDEAVGLLGGILQWIKDLYNKVVGGFENLAKGITELPQKIWSFIENGLKSLFVPDEEYMTDYSNKWDELLSQRFGAIYDVANIIIDFVEQIQITDANNSIYLPKVSLNSVGIPFAFGGYNVKVVPDGFGVLVEICKKILSIACTFLFINSLRKRYDEVMGVEK